jgi:glucokinase
LVARDAFAAVGDWLGVGLANLVAAFDPERIVIGGGVSAAGDRLLEPARRALVRSLVGAAQRVVPDVVRAKLGPEAGLVGAADLARQLR